jgi:hypothetical protein
MVIARTGLSQLATAISPRLLLPHTVHNSVEHANTSSATSNGDFQWQTFPICSVSHIQKLFANQLSAPTLHSTLNVCTPLKMAVSSQTEMNSQGTQIELRVDLVSKVRVILRPTVIRPVCPGIRPPSGTRDQFFFLLHGNYRQTFVYLLVRCACKSSRDRDHILMFHLRLVSLFVASYDSQDYDEEILTRAHTENVAKTKLFHLEPENTIQCSSIVGTFCLATFILL